MSVPLEVPALELLAILLAVLAGASLSALDAAVVAFGEVRLLAAKEEGGRLGRAAARILADGSRLTTRLQTGRVMMIVLAVGLTMHSTRGWTSLWLVTAALAGLALVYSTCAVGLGAVARGRATTWALPMAFWLRPLELLITPFAAPLGALVGFLDRRFPPPPPPTDDGHAMREVEHMIEKREESGSIPQEFADLLLSVLEFKDTVAREIMVPRTRMKAIEIETSLEEVLELVEQEGHSRYPVYRERVDQIEGVLYAKDLFRTLRARSGDAEGAPPSLTGIIRPAYFVAETHKIGQLLREMQSRRFHLAIVVDEFGGTSGIVTLEDIVEEIVGEIQDEHDTEEPMIQNLGDGRWWVDARVSVYDLAEALDVELDAEGSFDSVGGMVVDLAGRVPHDGETVEAHGLEFVVRSADERHVTQVEVRRASDPGPVEAAAE